MSWLPLLTFMSLLEATTPAAAERTRWTPSLNIEVAIASAHVWRGTPQYRSFSTPSFQPHVWLDLPELGPGRLTVDAWSAWAMSQRERDLAPDRASRIDLALEYDASLLSGWLEVDAGFVIALYPYGAEAVGAKEVMVRLAIGNLPIDISLASWTELHPRLGVYLEPRAGWELDVRSITVGMDLALGASIYSDEQSTLDHVTITAGLAHTVGRLRLALSLSYALRLRPGLGDFLERSMLYGDLGFSIAATGGSRASRHDRGTDRAAGADPTEPL